MNEKQLSKYQRSYEKQQRRWERIYEKQILKALRLQMQPVIEALQSGSVVMPNVQVSSEPIERVLSKLFYQVGVGFAKTVWDEIYDLTQKGLSLSLTKKDNLGFAQPAITAKVPSGIYSSWETYMINFFRNYGLADVQNITKTSIKNIQDALALSTSEGWGIEKTVRYLRNDIGLKMNKVRARLIARTETVTASNEAAMMSAESTGLQLNKQWSAAMQPERTREWHLLANRQNGEIPMYQDFIIGGEAMKKPGDAKASAKNRCNCRCRVVFVPIRN